MNSVRLYETRKIHDLREMLYESAALFRNRTAFYQKENGEYKPISFTKFLADVEALGTKLTSMGLSGGKFIILGENCYNWCLSYMTVVCGLGIVIPADKELSGEELANIAGISEATAVICSDRYAEKLKDRPCFESMNMILFSQINGYIEEGAELLSHGNTDYKNVSIDIDAVAALIFTSGTTGVSKSVMLSQRNICSNIYGLGKMIGVSPDDIDLCVLPLHHVYECNCGFLFAVYKGVQYAFSEGIRYVTKNMKEIRPTTMLCVPMLITTMYNKIWSNIRKKGIEDKVRKIIAVTDKIQPYSARMAVKRKMFAEIHESLGGRIKLLVSGGAAIDPAVIKGMRGFGFKIIQGYGLTECSPLAAVNSDLYYKDESAGLALPGGRLEIDNPGEDGTGEIRYRGDNVMLGYYKNPGLTAESKKNGWLYTGDIGYIDRNGFLIITGRKKNVIVNSNGKNIFPEELEAYLERSRFVAESVVVGIMNDKKKDYDIVAVIRPDYEQFIELYGKDFQLPQVEHEMQKAVNVANEAVQSYKRINMYLIHDNEFPKNSSRKIKRAGIENEIMDDYRAKLK